VSPYSECVRVIRIADKFADHFSKAYTCNNINRAAELDKEYIKMRAPCRCRIS